MSYHGIVDDFNFFMFKKEVYPLPFKYVSNYQLYLTDSSKLEKYTHQNKLEFIKYNQLTDTQLLSMYHFYLKEIEQNILFNIYQYDDFLHYLNNDNNYIYVDNIDKIGYFILLFDSKTNILNKKTGEFLFILFDTNTYTDIYNIMNTICYQHKHRFQNIIITNQNYLMDYIRRNSFEKSSTVYLHLYNFHSNSMIDKQNIHFMIP